LEKEMEASSHQFLLDKEALVLQHNMTFGTYNDNISKLQLDLQTNTARHLDILKNTEDELLRTQNMLKSEQEKTKLQQETIEQLRSISVKAANEDAIISINTRQSESSRTQLDHQLQQQVHNLQLQKDTLQRDNATLQLQLQKYKDDYQKLSEKRKKERTNLRILKNSLTIKEHSIMEQEHKKTLFLQKVADKDKEIELLQCLLEEDLKENLTLPNVLLTASQLQDKKNKSMIDG
jgi:hypothetical protein